MKEMVIWETVRKIDFVLGFVSLAKRGDDANFVKLVSSAGACPVGEEEIG